jgi:hypothetical protein
MSDIQRRAFLHCRRLPPLADIVLMLSVMAGGLSRPKKS